MLQFIRDKSRNPFLIGGVCAALVAAGCQFAGSADDIGPAPEYDGETLFRGVILGQGEVAELIPEIRDHYGLEQRVSSKEDRQANIETFDDIVAQVGATHPGYFDRFGAAMQSGDHVQIRRTLVEAAAITLDAVDQLGISVEIPELVDRNKCAAAAVVLVVAVAVALWLWVYAENQAFAPTSEHHRLLQEQIIDSIALRLAR
jgi:SdpC family antimicrobial peptide